MPVPVVVLGAGGFGREVHDVVADNPVDLADPDTPELEFAGFLDDREPDRDLLRRRGATWLGPLDELERLPDGTRYLIGIGSGGVRRRIDDRATELGLRAASVAHTRATFGADVRPGPGLVACANVVVTTNVTLGRHVHLNLGSTVGHDAVVGDYVTVNPNASISGGVELGDEVTVGTLAGVIQGLTVGAGTTIGAGAVVVKDLPGGVVATGVPAKPRG